MGAAAGARRNTRALKGRLFAVGLLLLELVLAVGAALFGFVAALGSLHDAADTSLGGMGLAVAAVWLAAARYGEAWPRHVLILAFIALSAALSTFDLGQARNWFD